MNAHVFAKHSATASPSSPTVRFFYYVIFSDPFIGLSEEQRTAAARQSREWQVDTPTLLQSRPLDDILRCLQILPTVSADTWSQPADAPSSVAAFDAMRVRRGVSAYRRELDGGAAMQLWVVERAAGRAREDEASDAPPAKRQHR